tara:strand:- start:41 stop:352 length:312 start_codon:yes stop_codon:yes gene_type:complete
MARALAKNENRSVTKQLVHMIREEAQRKGLEPEAQSRPEIENIIQEKNSSSQETVEIVEKPNLINTLEGLMEKLQDEDTTEQKGLTKLVETRKQNLETDPKTP